MKCTPCTKCGRPFDPALFYCDRNGYRPECIDCRRLVSAAYYVRRRAYINQRVRAYQATHHDPMRPARERRRRMRQAMARVSGD